MAIAVFMGQNFLHITQNTHSTGMEYPANLLNPDFIGLLLLPDRSNRQFLPRPWASKEGVFCVQSCCVSGMEEQIMNRPDAEKTLFHFFFACYICPLRA